MTSEHADACKRGVEYLELGKVFEAEASGLAEAAAMVEEVAERQRGRQRRPEAAAARQLSVRRQVDRQHAASFLQLRARLET